MHDWLKLSPGSKSSMNQYPMTMPMRTAITFFHISHVCLTLNTKKRNQKLWVSVISVLQDFTFIAKQEVRGQLSCCQAHTFTDVWSASHRADRRLQGLLHQRHLVKYVSRTGEVSYTPHTLQYFRISYTCYKKPTIFRNKVVERC